MAEELSTVEVAQRLGIKPATLLSWSRRGWLSPRSEGNGRGRRLFWVERDINEARDLLHNDSVKTKEAAFLDAIGGPAMIAQRDRALDILETLPLGSIVVIAASGVRVIREDDRIGPVLKLLGGEALVIQA